MLKSGDTLGHYEIVSPIGAGGMGEVYRARDTRLDRIVAVKVLPENLARDPSLRERFEREARAVSRLNHPHICTLHDVGEHDGVHFLVMEHLDGETLAERLRKGPLPLDAALEIADQIADALIAAHREGVVHRDLKPANIMLTKSGVKLLDFGLATRVGGGLTDARDVDASAAPTEAKPLTDAGTILGTVQYMAPEQLEGKEVDARADLFAFGAVLYEMVAGRKAFEGTSQASLISAIMSAEPPAVSELKPTTPPALGTTIRRCLAKDPDERWQTARDLRYTLNGIQEPLDHVPSPTPRKRYGRLAVGAIIAAGLLAFVLVNGRSNEDGGSASRYVVDIPPDQSFPESSLASPLAVAPDGRSLAYVAQEGGTSMLYLREESAFDARVLRGTEGAEAPTFSPDGAWIAFHANGRLKKIPVSGGTPVVLCDSPRVRTLTWGENETIVFTSSQPSVLMRVAAQGGHLAEEIATPDELSHMSPAFLPDGRHLLYGIGDEFVAKVIKVVSIDTGETRAVYRANSGVRSIGFVSTDGAHLGHLIYFEGDGLFALPFDSDTFEVKGTPSPVLAEIHDSVGSNAYFTTSLSGALAYVPAGGGVEVVWVDREGRATTVPIERQPFEHPRLAPDGEHVVLHTVEPSRGWVYDLARGGRAAVSRGETVHTVWSPDGSQLAYRSVHSLFVQPSDGSGEAELVWTSKGLPSPISWSRDDVIAFEDRSTSGWDIWILDVRTREAKPLIATPSFEASPVFSPDGKWLAYVSDEGGRREVYVQTYPGSGLRQPVSVNGGTEPRWSPDGRELFYRNGSRMLVVDVETSPTLRLGTPRELFEGSFQADLNGHPHYAVAPDGQRFLMLRNTPPPTIRVIRDWARALKELAPTE